MRSIEHPGPADPERIQCVLARVYPTQVELLPGASLLQSLAIAVRSRGASSAVFALRNLNLEPLQFVMPALSESPEHVAYFSKRFEANGTAHIDSGSITYGLREGEPWLHCHASWVEEDGRRHSGHVLAAESKVKHPALLDTWLLDGAGFEVLPDAETNFNLFQVVPSTSRNGGVAALVIRVLPNEDICLALERICAEKKVRRGTIRGGVGSLIGATFDDGRVVEPFVTEVFIKHGGIAPNSDDELRADLIVGLVAYTGEIASGRLARGENPALITFELVVEIEEFEQTDSEVN